MKYSYHNRIIQRINNREYINHEYVSNYPNIGEALVIYFDTEPYQRPIRPYKWHLYNDLLDLRLTPEQLNELPSKAA